MGFLLDHVSELETALLQPRNFDGSANGQWLAERYREIVPIILPDVLRCLDNGEPLTCGSIAALRESAQNTIAANVPLLTVLHGGIPALRVFTAFLQPHHSSLSAAELSMILGRASLVATELAACWTHAWSGAAPVPAQPLPPAAPEAEGGAAVPDTVPDLVAVPGQLEGADLKMVLLAAQGHSNEEIARATDYSPHAVKWHLSRAMRTWNVRNRASLITTALLRGALRPRPKLAPPPASD